MMKKTLGFFGVMMYVLTLSGCGMLAGAEDMQTGESEISQVIVEENAVSVNFDDLEMQSDSDGQYCDDYPELAVENDSYEEKTGKFGYADDDLVFREDLWGCRLQEGETIRIEKSRVIDEVDNAQSVVIFLNNDVYKEFDFDDDNIEFTIEKNGNYVFWVIDSEGNSVDITSTSITTILHPADGGMIPLE